MLETATGVGNEESIMVGNISQESCAPEDEEFLIALEPHAGQVEVSHGGEQDGVDGQHDWRQGDGPLV